IYQYYGLQPQEFMKISGYDSFLIQDSIYVFLPVNGKNEEVLGELSKLSDFMVQQGELSVARFVPTIYGYYVSKYKKKQYVLVRCMNQGYPMTTSEGERLSIFHYYGKQFREDVTHINQVGQWKKIWEQRLGQLEKFWQSKVMELSHDTFDEQFIDSFPYYLGLSETAIQYIVDTELDEEQTEFDSGTICHVKYHNKSWKDNRYIRLPFDWVYDHSSRDIAELIRYEWMKNQKDISVSICTFLKEYEQRTSLSTFA